MREIKFRGYSHEHESWIYGDLLQYSDGEVYIMEHSDGESLSYRVEPKSVGQCTGLKDKNGKEIYEGDIVRHRGYYGMKTSVVAFSNACFNVGRHQGSSTKDTPMLITANFEVVGNIHDNPELIKQ